MRRILLAVTFASVLCAAAPGFAFEVQSGGVPLSAQNVAMLASRMAGLGTPAQQPVQQPAAAVGRPMPPWGAGAEHRANDAFPGGGSPAMMDFLLGGRRGVQPGNAAAQDPLAAKGLARR